MAKVREKSGNFRIRRRNFKIVKEKQQVSMAVSSKNKHGCVCHSAPLLNGFMPSFVIDNKSAAGMHDTPPRKFNIVQMHIIS